MNRALAASHLPIVVSPVPATAPATIPVTAATTMADAYLRYVEGLWEGRPETVAFGVQLRACWDPALIDAGGPGPAVESPHGAGGRGIVWREGADEVQGCVRHGHGGYRVPLASVGDLREAGERIPLGDDAAGR